MAVRTVSVALRAELGGWATQWKTATNAVKEGREQIVKTATAHREAARDVSNLATGVGVGLVAAYGYAMKLTADFTKQMSAVEAATREGAAGMDALSTAALQAGKDTVYSATEAAKAQEELAKAGISTTDILGGGLSGALSLASAGGIAVAEAAETAATALKLFNLDGSKMPHVADLMAAAAGNAQGGVHDLGMALNMTGLVAAQFGLSIEETIGTLGAFASAGFLGSDAGTSFKTMLLRLAAPSGEAADLMADLGIAAYDASGQFVGITSFAGQLQAALSGMTAEQRDATMATLFGADAIRAANILYREGADGIQDWIDKVDQTGYAADVAATRLDNLSGDLEKLQGSIETNLIQAGLGSEGALRGLVQAATGAVDALGTLPPTVTGAGLALVGIGGATALAIGGLGRLVVSSAETRDALKELELSGSGFSKGFAKHRGVIMRMGIALAALQVVMAGFDGPAAADMTLFTESLADFGKTGELTGEALRILGKDMELFKGDAEALMNDDTWTNIGEGIATAIETVSGTGTTVEMSLANGRRRIQEIDGALAGLVQSGNGQSAIDIVSRLGEAAAAKGVNVHELAAALPQYQAALAGATSTETHAIDVAETHAQAVDLLAGSMDNAITATGGFKAAFDLLNGSAHAVDAALIAANRAVWDLKESLDENGNSLDLNTKAGSENVESIMGLADAAAVAAQAKYDETGSVEQATEVYNGYIDKLRAMLEALGLTPEAIQEVIDRYAQMPEFVDTKLTVTPDQDGIDRWRDDVEGTPSSVNTDATIDPDSEALDQWKDDLSGIPSTKSTWVYTYHQSVYVPDTSSPDAFKRRHGRARGGRVPEGGRGPTADDVPMNLSSGEYVVNAAASDANLAVLERINAGMSAYQAVGMSRPVMGSPAQTSSAPVKVQLGFDFTGVSDELGRALRKAVRWSAGGNVELALGRSG